jgi:uncharacterized short protein YbdD (DUF466 family)
MSARKILPWLLGLAVLLSTATAAWAQKPKYGVEEYNAYVDTTRSQDPNERAQAIESFLKNYPNSVLRAFVYPAYFQTAWQLKEYKKVMSAVDGLMGMDRAEVEALYKQSNYNDQQIEGIYYQALLLYTYSYLQGANGSTDALAARAAERAQEGLKVHDDLYGQVQPPDDPAQKEQFLKNKTQEESAFHSVLAFNAWRQKNYAAAASEYGALAKLTPDDPAINYRLGLADLQKQPPEQRAGLWYLARAIALGIPKGDEITDYLTKNVAAYQQAVPDCIKGEIDSLIASAKESATPPADWTLVSGERVNSVRQDMSLKRILDDLQVGGETARVMYLAACGSEIGMDESGQPDLYVKVLSVAENPDNLVTLQVAAGQEAAEAGRANMEVKVSEPPEATKLKADDVVRVSGTISGYQNHSQLLLQLADGRVRAEDIPKTR